MKREKHDFTLRDYIGSSCEVKSLYGEILAAGVAEDMGEDTLDVTGNGRPLAKIAYNTIVRVRLGGILPPFYAMGRVYLSSRRLLRIVDFRDVQSFERRLAFRVPVNIQGVVRRYHPPLPDDPEQAPVVEEISTLLHNVSLTGVYLSVERSFDLGDVFELEFMNRHEIFRMECVVRRTEQRGKVPCYGCMFQNMHIQMTNRLCALLFRLQGEQIRRVRGE